jgi:hypothetical protein
MPLFPRTLEIEMTEQEYNALKTSIQHKTVGEFVRSFKDTHTSVADSDITALAMMKAIDKKDVLSLRKILKASPTNVETIVTERADGKNFLSLSIQEGLIELVSSYISQLTKSIPDHQRYDADTKLLEDLTHAITHPSFDAHPRIIMQDVVRELLTTESYDQLVEMIGQDWLDSYHT